MTDTEHELAKALREEEQLLGAATLRRLAAARNHALTAPRPSRLARMLAPAMGAMVLASALGVAVLMPGQQEPQSGQGSEQSDNPELYRDLDFYLWLAESDMGRHG
jgi:ferric-dicitrate binding protein FerR (iron transport regulator)